MLGLPWKWIKCHLKTCVYLLIGTNVPQTPSEMQALTWALITSWIAPLLFILKDIATMICGSVPEPKQWFPCPEPCLFLLQCCLRAWRSRPSKVDFQPCHFHEEMSPDMSQSLWMMEYSKSLWFYIEQSISKNCSTICQCRFLQVAKPLPIFFKQHRNFSWN